MRPFGPRRETAMLRAGALDDYYLGGAAKKKAAEKDDEEMEDVAAEEPVEAFLTALRGRGYFDEALAYLDRVSQQDVSDDLQATIGLSGADLVSVFAETRKRKDNF